MNACSISVITHLQHQRKHACANGQTWFLLCQCVAAYLNDDHLLIKVLIDIVVGLIRLYHSTLRVRLRLATKAMGELQNLPFATLDMRGRPADECVGSIIGSVG